MAVSFWSAGLLVMMLASKTHGMLCWMGQEPDPNAPHRLYRWVIPVEDPCKCTEVRPGGVTNRTPNRHFKVIYFDNLLLSQREIREGLTCPDGSGEPPSSGQQTTTPSTTAWEPPIDSSTMTGEASISFDSACFMLHGLPYAPDPYDCTKYYTCFSGALRHQACNAGLYFNPLTNGCDDKSRVDCIMYDG